MYIGFHPWPRWAMEFVLGFMVIFPAVVEASLALGIPRPSTDPVLSAALALVLCPLGFGLLIHGIQLGRQVHWRDTTRKSSVGPAKTR